VIPAADRLRIARAALEAYGRQLELAELAHRELIHARAMPYDIDTAGERAGDLRAICAKLARHAANLERELAGSGRPADPEGGAR
jgi:hypothetical protein